MQKNELYINLRGGPLMLFKYLNYKEFLSFFISDQKSRGMTKAEIAKIMRCQATYLTQSLTGKSHLTEGQLLRFSEFFELNDPETEYLLGLLRLGKASSTEHRHYLERQLERMRRLAKELEPRLTAKVISQNQELLGYYASSWIPTVVHVATDCVALKSSEKIALRLGLPESTVLEHLRKLEKYELVKFDGKDWNITERSIHFSKNSQMDLLIQTGRRLLALHRLSIRKESNLHYSLVFATDERTKEKIRTEFLTMIERIHKSVPDSKNEDVYGLCLDLFLA